MLMPSQRRGGAKREPDRAKPHRSSAETFPRSDHPVCASLCSAHPPLLCEEGNAVSLVNCRVQPPSSALTNSQQRPAEQFGPARFLSAVCTSHLQLNCKPSFERCSSRSSSTR